MEDSRRGYSERIRTQRIAADFRFPHENSAVATEDHSGTGFSVDVPARFVRHETARSVTDGNEVFRSIFYSATPYSEVDVHESFCRESIRWKAAHAQAGRSEAAFSETRRSYFGGSRTIRTAFPADDETKAFATSRSAAR